MLCQSSSLVNETPERGAVVTLRCRAWTCPDCQPIRQRQLVDLAICGAPNRFVTLTVSPAIGVSPADRAAKLARAWRVVVARAKRQLKLKTLDYLAVFEATKRGEPHLHILCRCGFIPQRWISQQMREILNSPIVDIRVIRNPKQAARYIAKYIGKAPHRFATCKRYWHTKKWDQTPEAEKEQRHWDDGTWRVSPRDINEIIADWKAEGRHIYKIGTDLACWGLVPDPIYDRYIAYLQKHGPTFEAAPSAAAADRHR